MDELRELFNDLNGKLISAINALDGSTLAGKLIKSYQVDYLSSALILAEADDNDQEHLAAIRSFPNRNYVIFKCNLLAQHPTSKSVFENCQSEFNGVLGLKSRGGFMVASTK